MSNLAFYAADRHRYPGKLLFSLECEVEDGKFVAPEKITAPLKMADILQGRARYIAVNIGGQLSCMAIGAFGPARLFTDKVIERIREQNG